MVPGDGTSLIMDKAVTDFPHPDSPTIPNTFPFLNVKLTPSTALTTPAQYKNMSLGLLSLICLTHINNSISLEQKQDDFPCDIL